MLSSFNHTITSLITLMQAIQILKVPIKCVYIISASTSCLTLCQRSHYRNDVKNRLSIWACWLLFHWYFSSEVNFWRRKHFRELWSKTTSSLDLLRPNPLEKRLLRTDCKPSTLQKAGYTPVKVCFSWVIVDPDLHQDQATICSCLSKWSLHGLQKLLG